MTERPILFNDAMVRAILAGTKTQTRRVITAREPIGFIGGRGEENDPSCWGWFFDGPDHHGYMVLGRGHDDRHDHGNVSIPCPYGVPGDRLWVREAWAMLEDPGARKTWDLCIPEARPSSADTYLGHAPTVVYRTDGWPDGTRDQNGLAPRWRPSIHMPRWASRLTLEITSVRVERVQSISEEDARAEGVEPLLVPPDGGSRPHVEGFAALWDSINGEREGCSWAANPWVWALGFQRVEVRRG